jgi:hypothetical protein
MLRYIWIVLLYFSVFLACPVCYATPLAISVQSQQVATRLNPGNATLRRARMLQQEYGNYQSALIGNELFPRLDSM